MKRSLLIFTLFPTLFLSSRAQVFNVDTIQFSGNIYQRINLVILSDGYQEHELDKFIEDVRDFSDTFFAVTPYEEYQSFFNVFAIRVPSNESGANHPGTASDVTEPAHPIKEVDNYFGSTFDYYNIHRLLYPENTMAITNVLASNFPSYDQVVVLVNTPYYGGSGGAYATATTNPESRDVAIHELGHSFVDLKDEYWAGDIYAEEGINMTQETDPELVRWKNWLGDYGVGIYQHCCGETSSSWYKPHENCKMQVLNATFCPVCVEGTIERIHSLTNPIEAYSPSEMNLSVEGCSLEFMIDMVVPEPNTLITKWLLNGEELESHLNSVVVGIESLNTGENVLSLIVEDTTELLRVNNHENIHVFTVSWNVMNNALISNESAAICEGDSIYLQGAYQRVEGTYYDTLISAGGCDSIVATSLVVNQVDATFTSSGETIVANASDATFQWLDCTDYSAIAGATDQSFTPGENGEYAVAVTQNGCTDTSACYSVATIGIPEKEGGISFTVFPNPVRDRMELILGTEGSYREYLVKIISSSGRIVYLSQMNAQEMSIDLSEIGRDGLYYIQLINTGGEITGVKKVILK